MFGNWVASLGALIVAGCMIIAVVTLAEKLLSQ